LRKLLTFGKYLKKRYNTKVYKIPLSISGFTCPNIDGKVAKGGCTFCENDSFSPNLSKKGKPKVFLTPETKENTLLDAQLKELDLQFKTTKKRLQDEYGAKKFIVYFQSFSNTYAPIDTLKSLYTKALSYDNVVGISVGTRCDCVDDDILNLLKSFEDRYEVWIEYGIQSVHNSTLDKINRAESIEDIKSVIKKSKDMGLNVCGHLIFGLPNENQNMMLDSVKQSIDMKIDSIKIHPLYVVKNTALAVDVAKDRFEAISEELYVDTLVKAIKILPDSISIQRVTAGIDDVSLLTPQWCKDKNSQMRAIRDALRKENIEY
jgi:radical SAM protein (TIGR01212 family)